MADIFTPSKGGDVENFTGRSQGGTPHRAQEFTATGTTIDPLNTLLEGASKLFFSGIGGMDNLIKEDIKEQILVDVDAAQAANGLGEFNRRADFLNSETDSLPDIDREISSLERLKKAKESGAFNERSYYTQLLATSRRLRNQYPSYRAEIDAKMQSLSGVDPANAILRMIDSEQKAAAAAARAKANDQEKFLLNNAKYAYGLPDTMSSDDKISIINRRKQAEHLIELETKTASLRDKNQEEAREQIFASAAKRLAIQSDNDRTVVLSAMGLPIAEAEKKWQDMLNQGTMTPEIEQGLRGLETQLRVELPRRIQEIQAFANQNNLSPAQTSALIDQASFRHKALIQSLERKDLRPLAIAETALKIEEINDRNVVRAVEGVRVQAALGRELSPETMKVYSSQPNAMSVTGRIATEVASLSLLNKTPVSAAMKEIERRSEGKATEEDILHPIRANVQTLGAEDPKVAAKAAATLYQAGNNNMMATVPGNRVDVYQQVFGVKAQKDVEKIGDPVLIKHMAASAIANAKDVIAKSVRTVMAANENTLDRQYIYDINTGQIRDIGKVTLSPLEEFSTYQRASSAIAGQAARNELVNINATFGVLRPLVEKAGLDWNNVVLDLFKAAGEDPYRPAPPWKTPGQWFNQLGTAVIDALRPGRDAEFPGFSDGNPITGGQGSDEVGGGDNGDRLSGELSAAPATMKDTATNLLSRALGDNKDSFKMAKKLTDMLDFTAIFTPDVLKAAYDDPTIMNAMAAIFGVIPGGKTGAKVAGEASKVALNTIEGGKEVLKSFVTPEIAEKFTKTLDSFGQSISQTIDTAKGLGAHAGDAIASLMEIAMRNKPGVEDPLPTMISDARELTEQLKNAKIDDVNRSLMSRDLNELNTKITSRLDEMRARAAKMESDPKKFIQDLEDKRISEKRKLLGPTGKELEELTTKRKTLQTEMNRLEGLMDKLTEEQLGGKFDMKISDQYRKLYKEFKEVSGKLGIPVED